MSFWVYVPENAAGRFYVGQTDDLARRLAEHNDPEREQTKFTRKISGPWRIVWHEEHPTRESAMQREKQMKAIKSAKWIRERLLNS